MLLICRNTLFKDGPRINACHGFDHHLLTMSLPFFFVFFSPFDEDTMLYHGPQCQITLSHSHFQHKQSKSLSLQLHLSTSDGDTSPFSENVGISLKRVELKPGPPQELRVISCTATEVRLKWGEPEAEVKSGLFQVYCDNVLLETTTELDDSEIAVSQHYIHNKHLCDGSRRHKQFSVQRYYSHCRWTRSRWELLCWDATSSISFGQLRRCHYTPHVI
ncbi:uncharacterized protein LOC125140355 [Tachysurus fulvidraco]|uniref:uncharacterized protein LOC125140355 n=1 Tax=Tachysurus fulvidraco TaxID=1234273 RepID=UPI001FEF5B40|nr:uncharacterized protein LOC125140355 [Tachysurus fulvidraco]